MSNATPSDHASSADSALAELAQRVENESYWKANVRLVGFLLGIWFVASFGAGIVFSDLLDAYKLPGTGFPLGFWFAQQGAILVFVAIVWAYAGLMNRLEHEFGVDEE